MVSQATKIRNVILRLLKDEKYLQPVSQNSNILGIQYKDIKNILSSNKEFTEGAIIGTLNTLTERMPMIKKIKTEKGTFFFEYKSNNVNLNTLQKNNSLEENIDKVEKEIEEFLKTVRTILKETNNQNYEQNPQDIEYLHNVLKSLTTLRMMTDDYENNKLY